MIRKGGFLVFNQLTLLMRCILHNNAFSQGEEGTRREKELSKGVDLLGL